MSKTTTNFGFQEFFSTWLDEHPGSGLIELANALLENLDTVLATRGATGGLLLAPSDDQILIGGFGLYNDGGIIGVLNSSGSPSTGFIEMFVNGAGQGILEGGGALGGKIQFNPVTGSIALTPPSGGADDGGHGVVVNDTGLFITGRFDDGVGLNVSNGLAIIQGGGGGGNPGLVLGSSGVQGVLKTVPGSGGGSYTVRSPATSLNNSVNLPPASGTLLAEVAPVSTPLTPTSFTAA